MMNSDEYFRTFVDEMVQREANADNDLTFDFEADLQRLDAADPAIGLEEGGYIF
jgi:hypothetical protein